jgi:NTE family protein
VLRALAEANVPIDCVAGSSVGACVGALFARGLSLPECLQHLDEVGRRAWRLTVPTTSLISSAGLRAGLQQVFGDTRIEDLPLPLGVVAADIISYQEVVFRRGPIWAALLASSSIPGVWPPQRIGDHLLLDGGIVNPVPTDVVAGMGAGLVIAVKLAKQVPSASLESEASDARAGGPSAIQAILRAVELMQGSISRNDVETPTIQIDVLFRDVDLPGLRHFPRGRRFVALGEEAARLALPRVVAALPWLRP